MPRNGFGTYSLPANTEGIPDEVIESARYNAFLADLVSDLNAVRPVNAGGTGRNNLADFRLDLFSSPILGELSAGTPFYSFDGDPDTGIGQSAVDTLYVKIAGVNRLTFNVTEIQALFPLFLKAANSLAPQLAFEGDGDTGVGSRAVNTVSIFAANGVVPRFTVSATAVDIMRPTNITGNTLITGTLTVTG